MLKYTQVSGNRKAHVAKSVIALAGENVPLFEKVKLDQLNGEWHKSDETLNGVCAAQLKSI